MNVTDAYLKAFAMPGIGKQPKKLQLTEWEEDADRTVSLDDVDGQSLAILYFDKWPTTEQWNIQPGTDKRWTLVRITKVDDKTGEEIINPIGYEFEGLYTPDMLKEWFISHLKLKRLITPLPSAE